MFCNKKEKKLIPQVRLSCDTDMSGYLLEKELKNIKYCINEGFFSIWENNGNFETFLIPNKLFFPKEKNYILIEFLLQGHIKKFNCNILKIIKTHLICKEIDIMNNFSIWKKFDINYLKDEVSIYDKS